MTVERGAVYRVPPVNREYLVISIDAINRSGTVIVVEVAANGTEWSGSKGLLSVPVGDRRVLAWRVNYLNASRLQDKVGEVEDDVLDQVITALKAAVEP